MHPFRSVCVGLAFAIAPLVAVAQSSDIQLETSDILEYHLRMSIAPGTEQVYCYQQSGLRVVGSVNVTSGTTATVPVSLPDPVIRCAACNAWGCSSLSGNAAVVMTRNPLDVDGSGSVDVNDMAACITQIQYEIY